MCQQEVFHNRDIKSKQNTGATYFECKKFNTLTKSQALKCICRKMNLFYAVR